jgi:hypothetical protein
MQPCEYHAEAEEYHHPIYVRFDDIPPVRLRSIKAKENPTLIDRLVLATKPREFGLHDPWCIQLDNVPYDSRLNGSFKIPTEKDGESIDLDGASIPLPWLISLLTLGILRPLGVMLTASIVHDFAYKFGYLPKDDGTQVKIERHVADLLFRDILESVNRIPLLGFIAWFAVRLGWPFVKYAGKPGGGKKPYGAYLVLLVILAVLLTAAAPLSFSAFVSGVATVYAVLYFVTTLYDRTKLVAEKKKTATKA